jgi:hypothetical protein
MKNGSRKRDVRVPEKVDGTFSGGGAGIGSGRGISKEARRILTGQNRVRPTFHLSHHRPITRQIR